MMDAHGQTIMCKIYHRFTLFLQRTKHGYGLVRVKSWSACIENKTELRIYLMLKEKRILVIRPINTESLIMKSSVECVKRSTGVRFFLLQLSTPLARSLAAIHFISSAVKVEARGENCHTEWRRSDDPFFCGFRLR